MSELVIAVLGLGYVGLPLAIEFGKKYRTFGLDLSLEKVTAYQSSIDPTAEISEFDFKSASQLTFGIDPAVLSQADVIIIAVPTPVDIAHKPDFSALTSASTTVGKYMKQGVIVVYESTVYPGATEEVCIPLLEKYSQKKWKSDFNVGYSPERVNPGDIDHTIKKIVKVVSGDNENTLQVLSDLYGSIIDAGVYRASSIKVAEAAKVIENTQRDLNIALMNELSIIFDRIGIDTKEVLDAAATKWNFLSFKPGLVGGHCIGVDPYYLTHKAEMIGYHSQVILSGRRINDGMAAYLAQQTIKKITDSNIPIKSSKIIVLGITFKENCMDLRNSGSAEMIKELQEFGCNVYVHDPMADSNHAINEYGITLMGWDDLPDEVDAVIAAVPHSGYLEKPINQILNLLKPDGIFIDVKSMFSVEAIRSLGYRIWRL